MIVALAQPDDMTFICDSWMKSWRSQMRSTPTGAFYAWARPQMERILDTEPTILTIRDEPDSEWLCSYIVATLLPERLELHWGNSKLAYRSRGYFGVLVDRLVANVDPNNLYYTIPSDATPYLIRRGFKAAK